MIILTASVCETSCTQPLVSHFFKAFGHAFLSDKLTCSLVAKMLGIFLYSHVKEECVACYGPQMQVP